MAPLLAASAGAAIGAPNGQEVPTAAPTGAPKSHVCQFGGVAPSFETSCVVNTTLLLPGDEGGANNPFPDRQKFLELIVSKGGCSLEFGPFCKPLLRGPSVEYFDVLNAEGLRTRAKSIGLSTNGCPDVVHFVHPQGNQSCIPSSRYNTAFSSHSIEHQPDLVRHLVNMARVLRPGGRYWALIPDKRFIFDHFVPETRLFEVLEAYYMKQQVHSPEHVFEHRMQTVHNNPHRHWAGDHGTPRDINKEITNVNEPLPAAVLREIMAASRGDYVDVHAWKLTPALFRELITALHSMNLIPFEVERVYPTHRNNFEFFAVLRKVA